MKGYKILCSRDIGNGFIIEVLNKDSLWNIASNDCLFKTLKDARYFFKNSDCALRGSLYIEGPRGGLHRLFESK
jgi:hypothetical protein